MKRTLALTLALALTASLLACGSGGSQSGETTDDGTDAAETTPADSLETVLPAPELPTLDMKERKINILTAGWWGYAPLSITDITAESMNGDVMNDVVYERIADIEEKYNCTINQIDNEQGLDCADQLSQAAMSGENLYDLALLRSRDFGSLIGSELLTDLGTVPHLNLDAPYYDARSLSELELGGKNYGVLSNLSMNHNLLIFCAYFNKVMQSDYNLDDPYALVRSGAWTVDKMHEMCRTVAADLDNNGTRDQNDRFGAVYVGDMVGGFISASGVRFSEKKDGEILPTHKSEGVMNKLQELYKFFEDTDTTFCISRITTGDTSVREVGMFIDGQTLFSLAGIYYAPQFREMKDDYGILPLPKYDEAQDEYYSPLFPNVFPLTVIPRSNNEPEFAGIILEEMSYRGYTEMLPALYDTLLTGKCARDDNSVEMLDIIFGNTTLDISMVFDFGGLGGTLQKMFITQQDGFASTLASIDEKIDADIEKLLSAVKDRE